jgi:shikimate kinase
VITVVIGQRGSGKTHLLNRVKEYLDKVKCIDLDQYIERACKKTVSQIFQEKGETYFRNLERKKFAEIVKKAQSDEVDFYISVGGGFDCSLIPESIRVLWLRRTSEQWGRIFTDRPRLNPELSAIEEFFERAKPRAKKFARYAWEEYLLPEGLRKVDSIEKSILFNFLENIQCGLTILPENLKKHGVGDFFLKKRLSWGLKFLELRDDLLNKTQFERVAAIVPKEQLLFSLRSARVSKCELAMIKTKVKWIDCDQSLIDKYQLEGISIISRHHRIADDNLESIFAELEFFEDRGLHVKLAVVIDSFQELQLGHKWFMAKPKQRSFLPRSNDGRWQWYRLLMHGKMFIEFLREGDGSAQDQPSLYQWLHAIDFIQKGFSAILGEPVNHSFTPIEQAPYFRAKNLLVLAIKLDEAEFLSAMEFLTELGLKAAAVTSPLKKIAFQWVQEKTAEAIEFESVNTLALSKGTGQWLGANTDLLGLAALLKGVKENKTAVWGGGGTLPLIQKILPKAKYFSSQRGVLRENSKTIDNFFPEYVIWAAPRADGKLVLFPPIQWKPKKVIDLNYREDSGGREYALRCGAHYVSGEEMFYVQAEHQRSFWEKTL